MGELECCQQQQLNHKVAFRWVMAYYQRKGLPLSDSAAEDHRNWRMILSSIDETKSDAVVNRVSKAIKLRDLCFAIPKSEDKQEEKKEAMDEKFLLGLADQDEELEPLKITWQSQTKELEALDNGEPESDSDDEDDETCTKQQRALKKAARKKAKTRAKTLRSSVKALKQQLVLKARSKMKAEFDLYNSAYSAIPHVYEYVLLESGLGTVELNLRRMYTYFNREVINFIEGADDFYSAFLDTTTSDLQIEQSARPNKESTMKATAMVLDWAGESFQ